MTNCIPCSETSPPFVAPETLLIDTHTKLAALRNEHAVIQVETTSTWCCEQKMSAPC